MFSHTPHHDTAPSLSTVTSLLGDGVWGDGGISDDMWGPSAMAGSATPPCLRFQKPALFLLSSLFQATYLSRREMLAHSSMATLSRAKIALYSGESLDQFDLDILLYCAQQPRAATGCMVSPAVLLREMHLRHDERNRARLFDGLARLHTGCLEVRKGKYRYMSRFLNRLLLEEGASSCLVEVNDEVLKTLGRGPQRLSKRQERFSLGRHGVDKWLHGALAIFAAGFEADLPRLQQLMGLQHKSGKAYREMLIRALKRLGAADIIADWEMHDGRVVICGPDRQGGLAGCSKGSQIGQGDSACGFLQHAATPNTA